MCVTHVPLVQVPSAQGLTRTPVGGDSRGGAGTAEGNRHPLDLIRGRVGGGAMSTREPRLPKTRELAELQSLMELAYGDGAPAFAHWHSDSVVTIVYVTPANNAFRARWILGDSGRWSMVPLAMSRLDGTL